jgi:hypothetical protein
VCPSCRCFNGNPTLNTLLEGARYAGLPLLPGDRGRCPFAQGAVKTAVVRVTTSGLVTYPSNSL